MIILVTGGSGMVGRSLKEIVVKDKNKWIFLSSKDCDLTNKDEVLNLFKQYNPDYIIHLAANVGGLFKHIRERILMFTDNVRMNENVLEACNKYNVQKGIFCLSSCIYPHKPSKFPMNESMIHESEPHPSNEGYSYSKRMLEMQCRNYNEQYGRKYICLIPVNLYGPYDNFNINDSHVVPGLIHRFYNAKKENSNFTIYGSGTPLRQFLYSYDFAKIIVKTLFEYNDTRSIICSNDEISIKDLVDLIAEKNNFDGKISSDLTKSDGCMRKTVDNSYFLQTFPDFEFTKLGDGISKTIDWFANNYGQCRK